MREGRKQVLDSSMPNQDAYAFGLLARDVAARGTEQGVGDEIDRGLILSRLLNERGYEIVKVHDVRCNWGTPGMTCNCAYLRPRAAE